jgi:hypothetical protein
MIVIIKLDFYNQITKISFFLRKGPKKAKILLINLINSRNIIKIFLLKIIEFFIRFNNLRHN